MFIIVKTVFSYFNPHVKSYQLCNQESILQQNVLPVMLDMCDLTDALFAPLAPPQTGLGHADLTGVKINSVNIVFCDLTDIEA